MFLHGFQQSRLRFRRGTVDFVRENNVAENRPRLELELRVTVFVFHDDISSRNVSGHQIGRKLNTRKRQIEYASQRTHQPRFADARNAFKQHIASGDHCDDRPFHYVLLSDDIASDLFKDVLTLLAELSDICFVYHFVSSSLFTSMH